MINHSIPMFVIVLTTSVNCCRDKLLITAGMDHLVGSKKWSVDLDDEDKVLRTMSKHAILAEVYSLLKKHGFKCGILGVYDTNLGIDHPLLYKDFL